MNRHRDERRRMAQPHAVVGAVVLLLALVAPPSSGLVLCRGVDGHLALETLPAPTCCAVAQRPAGKGVAPPPSGGCERCVDTPITSFAAKVERFPAPCQTRGTATVALAPVALLRPVVAVRQDRPVEATPANPHQLHALRTVVLLI